MADGYNGVGGSFTIDLENGDVKPTIPVAPAPKIEYSSANDETLKGESNDGSAN